MTTAHKATFHPAIGRADPGGFRFHVGQALISARNLPGQTKMKFRQVGQCSAEEMDQRDLKGELLAREQAHLESKHDELRRAGLLESSDASVQMIEAAADDDAYDDADDSSSGSDSSSDDSDGDDDSDDEEAELLRELAKIKREREEDAKRQMEENERKEEEAVLSANPLMAASDAASGSFIVKRRWDDDVIFKNQAADEPAQKKRFVNDTIRNDFHVRFLQRYIK